MGFAGPPARFLAYVAFPGHGGPPWSLRLSWRRDDNRPGRPYARSRGCGPGRPVMSPGYIMVGQDCQVLSLGDSVHACPAQG